MRSTNTKYRTIPIPEDLAAQIDVIVDSNIGFVSLSEFVRDAVRRRLEALEVRK